MYNRKDSSRSVFAELRMFETKGIWSIIVDVSCLLLAGLPFAVLNIQHTPFKRGFFCSDDTIKYPFKEDTISYQLLMGIMIPFALLLIIFGECFSVYLRSRASFSYEYIACVYKAVGSFVFGAALSQSLTDIAKYTIGRLRPHFLTVCKPNWSLIDCKSGYIENFTCTGDPTITNEGRCISSIDSGQDGRDWCGRLSSSRLSALLCMWVCPASLIINTTGVTFSLDSYREPSWHCLPCSLCRISSTLSAHQIKMRRFPTRAFRTRQIHQMTTAAHSETKPAVLQE